MNILALDLGSQMGWATIQRDGTIKSGSESFAPAKHDGHGGRFLAFMAFLNQLRRQQNGIHAVYYEDVKNHKGVLAAHAFGGFLAILQAWCFTNGRIPLYPVGVGKVKQHWTGLGNARKDKMIDCAHQRGFSPFDDNEADALAILSLACVQEEKPFPAHIGKPAGALL